MPMSEIKTSGFTRDIKRNAAVAEGAVLTRAPCFDSAVFSNWRVSTSSSTTRTLSPLRFAPPASRSRCAKLAETLLLPSRNGKVTTKVAPRPGPELSTATVHETIEGRHNFKNWPARFDFPERRHEHQTSGVNCYDQSTPRSFTKP